MARARDGWFDWRGGLNTTFSPDILDKSELRYARNARLTEYGGVSKRSGTQRGHATTLGGASGFSNGFSSGFGSSASVIGMYQWDNPSVTAQLVAICDGDLNHKTVAAANYTNVSSTLSTTVRVSFAPYKTSGTNRLYFADGALRKWTATTLTTSISGAPSAKFLRVYKERMFASDGTQTIYWSKINDPETWAAPDGGQANVETYDSEGIVGMEVVGSSLLILKPDSIARFTGTTADTIDIDKGTEGVSSSVGCVAAGTICRADDFMFFLSDRGPHIATEGGVVSISMKIEAEMPDWNWGQIANSVAVFHPARKEILLFVPGTGSSQNNLCYCYNTRAQAWTGPWGFSQTFAVCSAGRYEKADGTEGVMVGGYDGFVRDMDYTASARDDVLSSGVGGTDVVFEIEMPPLLFNDPSSVKDMKSTQWVQAALGGGGTLTMSMTGDERPGKTSTATIVGSGSEVISYPFHGAWRGRRPILRIKESTNATCTISGLTLEAILGRRVM